MVGKGTSTRALYGTYKNEKFNINMDRIDLYCIFYILSRKAWINCKCSLFRSSYQDLSTNVTSSLRADKKEIRKESHDESVVFWRKLFLELEYNKRGNSMFA